MPPSNEMALAAAEQRATTREPRLKSLASKPLKLAASTFKQRTSRTSPTIATLASDSSSMFSTIAMGESKKKRYIYGISRNAAAGLSPAQVASAARGPRKPLDGEEAAAWLRVRVVKAEGLVAKDRGGTSDPFLSLLMPPATRHTTPVIKKTLDPVFPAETSTFDFPIYLSLAGVVGGRGLEGVLWDKDLMRKEYMGELAIPIDEWFPQGQVHLWHENNPTLTHPILSTRRKHKVSGTCTFQIGFVPPKGVCNNEALKKVRLVYEALVDQAELSRGSLGVLGVPAYKGIGTVKMRNNQNSSQPAAKSAFGLISGAASAVAGSLAGGHKMISIPGNKGRRELEEEEEEDDDDELLPDDGMSSSSSADEFEDALEEEEETLLMTESSSVAYIPKDPLTDQTAGLTIKATDILVDDRVPKTAGFLGPDITKFKTPTRQASLPVTESYGSPSMTKSYLTESTSPTSTGLPTPGTVTPGGTKILRPLFKRGKSRQSSSTQMKTVEKKKSKGFEYDATRNKETLGIVILEIKSASDLPKLKNALKFSFDMDPFVVISFGKKVFRTRVIRHSLNPTWDEKLLFHVRRHEASYTAQFAVLDWDKVSGNDMVGTCTLPLSELIADAPKPHPETGLYDKEVDGKHEMKEFTLPISTDKDMPWEAKHSPKLTIRAKYEPYDALRQRFWRQYITQYDADDTGALSYPELTAMLDSLGSTLTRQTLEGYFEACGKSAERDELTIEEAIKCLENEVNKSRLEKAKVNPSRSSDEVVTTGTCTPSVPPPVTHDALGLVGPHGNISSPVDPDELTESILKSRPRVQEGADPDGTGGNEAILVGGKDVPALTVQRAASFEGDVTPVPANGSITPQSSSDADVDDTDTSPADDRERIINIKACPLCHRPRMNKRSEQDIVTHLAICASADWSRVDRIVTTNYVTSSQAQRKFLSKIVNKVAIGSYALGANSANTIVQDRITGQLQEEKMAVYVRMGIRILYKGAKGSMHGAKARKLLKSLSIKQGLKYDSPASVVDIPGFIAFHNLNVDEILDPLDSFKTFNEFFYRKLKASARPIEEPKNATRLVSCADCRMMAFETVTEATQFWIKGREFTVAKLLGPNYQDVIERYEGGALAIYRLAPQDYHRFHSPVKGIIGKMTMIEGEYYTVNPQAIRSTLDVYGENVRKIVPIKSEEFGLVMSVWVGAMMVGSILTSVEEGQQVDRGDELGYFAFGGSTIVCLFERGALKWDEDLIQNGRASIETLVRMGMGVGRSARVNQA
ncbi:phosphatidylserine decarboxylase [Cryptococcus depauperatus]